MGIKTCKLNLPETIISNHLKAFVFLFFMSLAFVLRAQEAPIENVDGKNYHMHLVEKGATLYSISRYYDVKVDTIIKENPFLQEGLKPGQTLKIPVTSSTQEKEKADSSISIQANQKVHKVKRKETLYGLSKKYDVSVRQIIDLNQEVKNGLSIGQLIIIPEPDVNLSLVDSIPAQKSIGTMNYMEHEVQQGETLYSLSKSYKVNADSVIALNNGLVEGLKAGMILYIPKEKPHEIIVVKERILGSDTTSLNDSVAYKNMYNVALMLPFYLDLNDTLEARKRQYDQEKIYEASKLALQFYQGALTAIDSLQKQGVSVRLYVYDTANDTARVNQIIDRPEIKEMDLFIGPLFKKNFVLVSDIAKQEGISIVAPVPQSNKVLLGNPYVSKVSGSRMIQIDKMAEYVAINHYNDNVFVFNNYEGKDIRLVDRFHRKVKQVLDTIADSPIDSIQEVYFGKIRAGNMEILMDSTENNIIVIPSNNQSYVSEFLTQLNLTSSKFDVTVYGLDKWKNFENINTEYLHNLNVHITAPSSVDFSEKAEIDYIKSFRSRYHTDPTKYGFLGFDVFYYYLQALSEYGKNFQTHLPEFKFEGVTTSFDYFQTSIESGFENQSTRILRYEDYKLVEVK